MAKKILRLTESDLHNVIKESVNKILTELDWRTYQSATDKSMRLNGTKKQAEYDKKHYPGAWERRMNDFHDRAADRFNQQYGTTDYENGNRQTYSGHAGGANSFHTTATDWNSGYENSQWVDGIDKQYDDGSCSVRGRVKDYGTTRSLPDSRSSKIKRAQERGDAAVRDYYTGKTKYSRDKGWH